MHVTTTAPASRRLRRLPPERWGDRLRRARLTTDAGARLTHKRAARWMSEVTSRPIDYTTIGRLEALERVPTDAPRRRNAYLLTILYSLDPAELDLTDDDGPGRDAVHRLRAATPSTSWYGQQLELALSVAA